MEPPPKKRKCCDPPPPPLKRKITAPHSEAIHKKIKKQFDHTDVYLFYTF
uniref:Uncharacterized protein n=1 Tax=viral metagenome TaxID=1070528 RepID=A0A6C0KBL5_9ZZZZ